MNESNNFSGASKNHMTTFCYECNRCGYMNRYWQIVDESFLECQICGHDDLREM